MRFWYNDIDIKVWYRTGWETYIGLIRYDRIIMVSDSHIYLFILDGTNGSTPDTRKHTFKIGNLTYREHDRFSNSNFFYEISDSRELSQILDEIRDKKIEEYLRQ